MKTFLLWLAFVAVMLFRFGYWICDLFFKNGSVQWWDLRLAIYTIIFSIVFFIGWKITTGFTRAVFLVGVVYCAGDILDRYLFDIQTFNFNDLLLDVFGFYYLIKMYAREIKGNT